jgi:Zn-dependent oligopeptidase
MVMEDLMLDGSRLSRPDDAAVRLSELHRRFRQNVSDAELGWSKYVEDETSLAGMTADQKAAAGDTALGAGLRGFLLGLDAASYDAVLRHADDRALRKELYEAYVTRASDRGPLAGRYDNGPVIDEILALRHQRSRGLGFANHAEAALRARMIDSAEEVDHFLIDLNRRARPRAESELAEVWRFARSQGAPKEFRPWDLPYWSEKLRRHLETGAAPPNALVVHTGAEGGFLAGLEASARLELALFDLRLHRDYVPEVRSSPLRSQVLDALAQVRREVSVLPPPPWNRMPSHFVGMFGGDDAFGWYGSIQADVLRGEFLCS